MSGINELLSKTHLQSEHSVWELPYKYRDIADIEHLPIHYLNGPMKNRLNGKLVRDMTINDHILIHFPRKSFFRPFRNNINANLSIYLSEPDALSRGQIQILRLIGHRYFRILTINSKLLKKPNARFFIPCYCSFAYPKDFQAEIREPHLKRKMVSLIASEKNFLEGHKLRHNVVKEIKQKSLNVDIMGRKYQPIKETSEGLLNYHYSVIIENSKQESYFSEKIIDALICETIPIYWGAPNIGNFFNLGGIIQCTSLQEIVNAIKTVSLESYNNRKEYILQNKLIVQRDYASRERPIEFLSKEINKSITIK